MNDRTVELDLDTLLNERMKIKVGNEVLDIEVPDLFNMLKIAKLGTKLQDTEANNEEKLVLLDEFQDSIREIFPELKDVKLNFRQMLALLEYVSKSAMPKDITELNKQGITLDGDQKKIQSE